MDIEFPSVILRPIGSFKTTSDYHYQTLKSNVDLLKPIQVGLTFFDPDLNHRFVFLFNFREFDPQSDVYASDSIDFLRQSGIDFEKNLEFGADVVKFGELLMSSGVALHDADWTFLPRPDSSGKFGRHVHDVHSVPDTPMLETTSLFGSASLAPSLSKLQPI